MLTLNIKERDVKSFITDYYKNNKQLNINKQAFELDISNMGATNNNNGLGDTLSLCHLQKYNIPIWSNSPYFSNIEPILGHFIPGNNKQLIPVESLQLNYALGGGHFFQRIQRAFLGYCEIIPKADLFIDLGQKVKNRVALNFNVGPHVSSQRRTIHPRARELYPEHRDVLQKYILDHQHDMEFWEFGTKFSGLAGVHDKTGKHILGTIAEMRTCEYYLALHSGLMHVAASLNLKSIIIINFPEAKDVILPALKDIKLPSGEEISWLYPQNVHLHSDMHGPLVPFFNYKSLSDAFEGNIYPYFSTDYCHLIN